MLGPVFSFFARNPIAQGIAGAFAVLFFMKANNWNERRKGRNEGRQEAIDDINEQTEDRIAEVKADLQLIDTIIDATPAIYQGFAVAVSCQIVYLSQR